MAVVLAPSANQDATRAGAHDWEWDEPPPTAPGAREARAGDTVDQLIAEAELATPATAVGLLRRAARMAETPLRDRERAFRILCQALRRDPGAAAVVADLERLAEIMSRWDDLLVLGEEVLRGVDDLPPRALLWVQLARWSRRLGRWSHALAAGENALALTPENEVALAEVEQIYRQIGHWGPLVRLLGRRVSLLARRGPEANRAELCTLHLELAALYEERLEDPEQAIAACERALALDRTSRPALTRLERLAGKHGRRLLLIDVLDRHLASASAPAEKASLALRLAEAWGAVGRNDRAARTLHAALAAGADDMEVRGLLSVLEHGERTDLAARADELCKDGHLVEALPVLEELARKADPNASDPTRAAFALRLGRARVAGGDRQGARAAFAAAVDLAPQSHAALETLIGLALDDGDFAEAVRWKEWLARRLPPGARRTELVLEVAQLYHRVLEQPARAVRVLDEAFAREPGARGLLEAMLRVHEEAGEWRQALAVLERLAASSVGRVRAAYLATAGELAARKLDALDTAVALFNRALDIDPTNLAVFARLDRMLARRRAGRVRAHNHRTMLARLQAHGHAGQARAAAIAIWQSLSQLLRTELADPAAAIDALRAAAALDPEDLAPRVALAQLYETSGSAGASLAIAQRCRLLERAPNRDELVLHVRMIHQLAGAAGDGARARRAAETLAALGEETPATAPADAAERRVPPPTAIDDATWARLRHPDQDARLAGVFATIGRVLLGTRSRELGAWRLGALEASSDGYMGQRLVAQVGELGAAVCAGAPLPPLRFAPDRPGLFELVATPAPEGRTGMLLAGAECVRARSRAELTTLVAKTLTYLRDEQLVVWPAVTTSAVELELAVLGLRHASGAAARSGLRLKINNLAVARYATFWKRTLAGSAIEQVAAVTLADRGAAARWLRGGIFTAGRVGLYAGGDIAAALQVVVPESFGALEVKPFEQVRDLVAFYLSDAFHSAMNSTSAPAAGEST
jgi:tetratricopeptide (TPR) repeat protein